MEITYAGCVRTESACGYGTHGMAYGVERVHGTQPVAQGTYSSKKHVDKQQAAGGIAYLGPEFVHTQPGHLGRKHIAALHLIRRDQCKGEHHDSYTAYPVSQASPEEQVVGHGIHVHHAGGTSGGKAADGFEEGTVHIHTCYEDIGYGTYDRKHHPRECDHQETVGTCQSLVFLPFPGHLTDESYEECSCSYQEKQVPVSLPIEDGH